VGGVSFNTPFNPDVSIPSDKIVPLNQNADNWPLGIQSSRIMGGGRSRRKGVTRRRHRKQRGGGAFSDFFLGGLGNTTITDFNTSGGTASNYDTLAARAPEAQGGMTPYKPNMPPSNIAARV